LLQMRSDALQKIRAVAVRNHRQPSCTGVIRSRPAFRVACSAVRFHQTCPAPPPAAPALKAP
jgi:hypothetical protein